MSENIDIIILVVFLVLTILFLIGKGTAVIAGLNTIPEKEKEKYNVKRISRQMGIMFMFIDIALLLSIILDRLGKMKDQYAYAMGGYVILVVIIFLIYIRKSNKKEQELK